MVDDEMENESGVQLYNFPYIVSQFSSWLPKLYATQESKAKGLSQLSV